MKYILVLTIASLFVSSINAGETSTKSSSQLDSIVSSASAMAGKVDWSKLSWDDLADIPYADKTELVGWAAAQAKKWQGPLTEATKKQGLNALSSLGSTGWQGYLKQVLDAIDSVKESNPETYEASKSALMGAWQTFETEATKYLKKG